MSGPSRKIVEALTAKIHKSPRLINAIENASERAQDFQNVASEKYDTLVKQVHGGTTTLIQDFRAAALEPSRPIPRQLVEWWKWYEHLTGIEDVEIAKRQVISVQDNLFKCQNHRRDLTGQASLIAEKLKDVYGELVQTRREDPKYVQLTIMENKSLQEQSRIMSQLRLLEVEERDHFTQLATAIKEYHDTQQMNAQKYKYLSILASAAIAIVSLGGSIIYNNRKIADVRNVIAEGQEKNEELFKSYFHSLAGTLEEIKKKHSASLAVPWTQPVESPIPTDESEIDQHIRFYEKKTFVVGTILFTCYLLSRLSS